jgi:hypothetical protein
LLSVILNRILSKGILGVMDDLQVAVPVVKLDDAVEEVEASASVVGTNTLNLNE